MKNYSKALKYLWSLEFISSSFKRVAKNSQWFFRELSVWFKSICVFLLRLFAIFTAPLFLAVWLPIIDFLNKREEKLLIKKKEDLVKSYTKNVASVKCRKEGWDD